MSILNFYFSSFLLLQNKFYLLYSKCDQLIGLVFDLIITRYPPNMSTIRVGNENVWFDGVDPKLIEMHSTNNESLVEGNDQTLMTKTPLSSFSSYSKKKKELDKKTSDLETMAKKASVNKKQKSTNGLKNKDTMKPNTGITEEVAMDCEMVECYHHKSVLARVSIVNLFGHPILDRYVAPPAKVTDYRTRYSGIRKRDLVNAPEFESVQKEVANIIKGRIVVGHALHNDFGVLKLEHNPDKVRDTSHYFKHLFQGKTPSLKKLTESILGIKIQKGEHDSVQDAQATMKIYVRERDKWNERILKNGIQSHSTKCKQQKKPMKKKIKTIYNYHPNVN